VGLDIQAGSRLGQGTQVIVTRFMGLIAASMEMQFVLAGMKPFFHA
jgi:small neutral amino acid transporter SnatA (MarC family)